MGWIFGGVARDSDVWVRQLAWLHSPIDPDFKPSKIRESRIDTLEKDSYLLQIKPEAYSSYIINLINQIGPYQNGEYGPQPLSWTELRSWSILTKTKITPWEADLIMKLSKSFVSQLSLSKDPSCISPVHEVDEEKLSIKRKQISDAFKSMAKIGRRKKWALM